MRSASPDKVGSMAASNWSSLMRFSMRSSAMAPSAVPAMGRPEDAEACARHTWGRASQRRVPWPIEDVGRHHQPHPHAFGLAGGRRLEQPVFPLTPPLM